MFFISCFFVGIPQVFAAPAPTVTSISPSSGPTAGGTNVTIVGTGFFTDLTVTIGGNAATNVVRLSSLQITATTPAGTAGAQDVTVTNTDTKSGTLTTGFTYEAAPHTITASAGAHGSISPSGAVSVDDGASQSFTITANANYYVADVLVDGVSVGAVTSHNFTNVIADHTIAASFGINTHTLTYTAGANGSITGTSPQTINSGSDGTAVVAVPATDYHFVNWSDASTANPRTDTNVTGDISVTANFEANPVIPPNQHTLTTSASTGGAVNPSSGPYDDGVEVQITATPSASYSFASWSGDLSGSTNPSTITMNGDKSVTANFEANPVTTYTLTYTAGANGSITGTSPQTVNSGSDGTAVTAVPATGYHFVNWSDALTANPRTDTNVTTDISVTANFAVDQTTPEPTPPPSGGGVGSGISITVTFSGKAYQGCAIEVLRKSAQDTLFQTIPTESASIKEDGAFEISHTGLISEEYIYALRIKDKDGRKTTLSFDVNLLTQNSFMLKDILAPPTVEVKNTVLLRAEDLQLIGYAAPNNIIEVEIDGIAQKVYPAPTMSGAGGTALAAQTGYYAFATSVGPLAVGAHYARVRQVAKDGKKSDWSQTKSFKKSLLLALKADFNSDGKVNITDWSVFLFRWGSQDAKLHSSADLDGNGKVDVIDLSIFLKTIQI